MLLSVLHFVTLILIALAVILLNIAPLGSENEKIQRVAAVIAVIAVVLSFALFIYDKVVGV